MTLMPIYAYVNSQIFTKHVILSWPWPLSIVREQKRRIDREGGEVRSMLQGYKYTWSLQSLSKSPGHTDIARF